MKYQTIEPKVEIAYYGPEIKIENQENLAPEKVVALASMMTYNNQNMTQNVYRIRSEEKDLDKTLKTTTVGSTGRGHASMTTSQFVWLAFGGTCSKLVDSMFTSAKFGTSLMPSGRRTGINKDQIVIPKAIAESNEQVQEIYVKASEYNIEIYEKLLAKGVKQDAAGKVVQYGIAGGGFTGMPLETIIGFALDYEFNPIAIPEEGKQIMRQLEQSMKKIGMSQTYAARKNAARATYPNPNIFKFGYNHIADLIEEDPEILKHPKIIHVKNLESKKRDLKLKELYETAQLILKSPQQVIDNWQSFLINRKNLIDDYNTTIEVHLASAIPWRVWGEVKRHRTMLQNAESIYLAIDRAKKVLYSIDLENPEKDMEKIEQVISIPPQIKSDKENLRDWVKAYYQSFKAYDSLSELGNGLELSDAVQVIPRGVKLGVEKILDPFNLTNGYCPLRLCGTAEEEMKRSTIYEVELIKKALNNDALAAQIIPKCGYIGFCLEPWKKCCHAIDKYVGFDYIEEVHQGFEKARRQAIEKTLAEIGISED